MIGLVMALRRAKLRQDAPQKRTGQFDYQLLLLVVDFAHPGQFATGQQVLAFLARNDEPGVAILAGQVCSHLPVLVGAKLVVVLDFENDLSNRVILAEALPEWTLRRVQGNHERAVTEGPGREDAPGTARTRGERKGQQRAL
jgi:hypothetical protein